MDIQYFFTILKRRIWLILSVMAIAAVATYILVGQLPDKYKANAILSTGIIEDRGFNIEDTNPFMQEFVTKTRFSNLIENMINRSSIRLLTGRLLKHDLVIEESEPFRLFTSMEEPKDLNMISPEKLNSFIGDLKILNTGNLVLEERNQEYNQLFKTISKALGYDYKSITENLEVKRIGETDYLNVEFTSESPNLSYYAVNTFCEEILERFRSAQRTEENTTISFYKNQVKETKAEFDSLTILFNKYKFEKNVVDIGEQTKDVVGHIRELELRKEQLNKEIEGLRTNISKLAYNIKRTSRETSSGYSNNSILANKIEEIRIRERALSDKYDPSKPAHKAIRDQLSVLDKEKQQLIEKYASLSDSDLDKSAEENRKLREKKLEKELELERAIAGVKSLEKEITQKQGRKRIYIADEANLGILAQKLDIAQGEYNKAVEKYNKAQIESEKPDSQLGIIEHAQMPEKPESKNRTIMSAFAGVASGVLATVVIFLLSFFDSSLHSPQRFAQSYQLPLIGHLNRLAKKHMDLNQIFTGAISGKQIDHFLESMRKIRFAVETAGASTFLITSNKENEGKSFFLLSLAYSLSLGNRKVLIIDTNFRNNSLSKLASLPASEIPFNESVLKPIAKKGKHNKLDRLPVHSGYLPNNVDILGNFGGNITPGEALAGKDFVKILYDYQAKYDYILLEGSALNDYSDSRELAPYADKVIGVFAAQSNKKTADEESVNYLKSLGEKYLGSVLNRVDRIE